MQNLIELRHILHAHPELSGQEMLTNGILNEWVKQTLPDQIIERIGGYGLAAIYKGAKPGKRILIRGDKTADYGTIMGVMAEISSAGYKNIGLVGLPQQGS